MTEQKKLTLAVSLMAVEVFHWEQSWLASNQGGRVKWSLSQSG